jgi:hypothetical protein
MLPFYIIGVHWVQFKILDWLVQRDLAKKINEVEAATFTFPWSMDKDPNEEAAYRLFVLADIGQDITNMAHSIATGGVTVWDLSMIDESIRRAGDQFRELFYLKYPEEFEKYNEDDEYRYPMEEK